MQLTTPAIGSNCSGTTDKCVTNAACSPSSVCACSSDYFKNITTNLCTEGNYIL